MVILFGHVIKSHTILGRTIDNQCKMCCNRLLNIIDMEFSDFGRLKTASFNGCFDPTHVAVTTTFQDFAVMEDDAKILEGLCKETKGHTGPPVDWMQGWCSLTYMRMLVNQLPMIMRLLDRQELLCNLVCLLRNLFRVFDCRDGCPRVQMLLFLGSSGCTKSIIMHLTCCVFGDTSRYVYLEDTTSVTLRWRVVVFADIADKNCLDFETLSITADQDQRVVDVKNKSHVVAKPLALIGITSNTFHVVKVPNGCPLNA